MSIPILQPRVFYGLKTDVAGNAHYISDNDVLYPVGNAIALHNFNQQHQKLLNLSDKNHINIIAISPNKKHVAVCEIGEKPTISIYDLQNFRRLKVLGIPYDCPDVKKFTCISFSLDSKYIAAVTDQPDQTMLYYCWEKGKIESSIKVLNTQNQNSIVNQILCNPGDIGVIALAGIFTFKLLTVSETIWRPYGFSKAENLIITSITWLNSDRLFAGTHDGRILYIENGDLTNIYKITEINMLNLKLKEEFIIASTSSKIILNNNDINENEIGSLISFTKGFVFAQGPSKIIVFEKDGNFKYYKKTILIIPQQITKNNDDYLSLYKINTISINPSSDRLIVTCGWSQIFTGKLWNDAMVIDLTPVDLDILGQSLHHGKINSLSMCAWKSIFMTTGNDDRSIRIWDFENENLIMLKYYQEDIFSVALHPIGLFCLIGFSDKLRFMTILIDDLRVIQEFTIRNCRIVSFSHNGHLFLAVNGNVIQIYSTIGFSNKLILRGHSGKIKSVIWSNCDMKIVSIGIDGSIYTWDISTGLRINEIIIKDVELNDVGMLSDNETIICISSDKKIREIRGDAVVRIFDIDNKSFDKLLVGKNDNIMFITNPGGIILSLKCPIFDPIEFELFNIHSSDIENILFSLNEQILVSTDNDGNICFWKIITSDTTTSGDFSYTNEILIDQDELEDKIDTINYLNTRMKELESENTFKTRQTELYYNERISEIHQVYTEAIEELKCNIDIMNEEKTIEMDNINSDIIKMKNEHEKIIKNMEINYDKRLIIEYDKYSDFERQYNKMRENYEDKLKELHDKYKIQIDDLYKKIDIIIDEKNLQIQDLQKEMQSQIEFHEIIKSQIEDDADREILEIKSNYESKLYDEKQINLKLTGEAEVLKNKYTLRQREIDDLHRQIKINKEEKNIYKKNNNDLEKDIIDLKNVINDRDLTIQDKEKKLFELNKNNQELEKYKIVLNYKIQEMKNIIEPKNDEITELKKKLIDIEFELTSYQKKNDYLLLKLNIAKEKIIGFKKQYDNEIIKNKKLQILIDKMKNDLANVAGLIQQPNELKTQVTKLYHRYSDEKNFLKSKEDNTDAYCEFLKQREQLERTIALLQKRITKLTESKCAKCLEQKKIHSSKNDHDQVDNDND
ncbi:hypothetical protein HCN44_006031 [Aphidius gifuensis]|uniref:Uncharacterized protein n=1 Tax=Aphidius gifuensis TaxID=684658 RepID=A0A835CYB2_APHGI|nr:cilia- and flagella-associated protein 57 [Aphidius gifuensis]KAF7997460.1 hypothetical protein HCN44_006031 [Aphidius gifuensis]